MVDERPSVKSSLPAGFDADAFSRLEDYIQTLGLGQETLRMQRLTGGQSNPTFRLTYGKHRMVLRKKPSPQLVQFAHAVEREHRVMAVLADTVVPVPETVHRCDDCGVIGTPFFLMDHVDGRVFTDPSLPGLTAVARTGIYREVARVMAALHDVDPDVVGLSDFGHRGGYFSRELVRWTQQYRESATESVPAMEALIQWLPGNVPDDGRTRIVHGDFHIDNLILHPTEPRVLAIIDWELSTLGHPYADLAHHAMAWHVGADLWRGMADKDLATLGIPSESAFISDYLHYRQADPIAHWDAYLAYSLFRIAAMIQDQAARQWAENPALADVDGIAARVASLAELGWHHAQLAQRIPLFRSGKQ